MAESREEQLEQLFLDQLPLDGSTVSNGQLLQRLTQAGLAAALQITEAEFNAIRDALLAQGLVIKGKGRGGSTARAPLAAPGSEQFELGAGAAAIPDEPQAQPMKKASKSKGAAVSRGAADEPAQVISYRHADKRKNNPEVGLVNEASDPQQPKKTWAYNPHLDPVLNFDSSRAELESQVADALASGEPTLMKAALEEIQRRGAPYLQWAGKAERTSFEVDTVSLHVHERIDPMSILSAVRKGGPGEKSAKPADEAKMRQASLFEAPFENLPLRDAVDFYRHDKGWANRLVSGDSLQVMNSLLVKEGMAGQVQMVYIDPPYGIKYGSNFQPFVGKRDVKDKSDADLTQEPEMIKAFRDTWELGIHSYLSYLRDRLLLARELLTESGSVFVQISDDNLHLVRQVMDEVMGSSNCVAIVVLEKTSSTSGNELAGITDYLVWYGRDKSRTKFNPLFKAKELGGDGTSQYTNLRLGSGQCVRLTASELTAGTPSREGRVFAADNLTSQRPPQGGDVTDFPYVGRTFSPGKGTFKTEMVGLTRLGLASRLRPIGDSLMYVRYLDDFAVSPIANYWSDTKMTGFSEDKVYVVQTPLKAIERCLLMSTEPGDLVLDPTCGSGTTAFVAEKWGRRWITCDTSRVAVTLAKQRLMTASFDYYELAYPHEGLKGGFIYKTV